MTFQDALSRRGAKFRTSPGDRNKVHLNCPFCTERGKPADAKFRLCVHARDGWGRCMHCDWRRKTAIHAVLRALGIQERIEGFEPVVKEEFEAVELPDDFQCLIKVYDELDKQARQYVLKRGILPQQIRDQQIGVSYTGRYAYRIVFPVYEKDHLVGINARDFLGTQKPKYLTNRGDKYLYNFNPERDHVVLSEGVFKALRIAQTTSLCSGALLGHDLTDVQAKQLKESKCRRITLYPDTDNVGRKGFLGIADKLEELDIDVDIVWPVLFPADEEDLAIIAKQLKTPLAYSSYARNKIGLASR